MTADGSGFTPVLHASGERYMSDSPESDTLGVQDGMSDDVQSTVVAPFIAPSAETSQTTPVRKSETANSLFAPLAPDEMAAYVAIDGKLAARIVLRDVPRANAKRSLARLHELGIKELSMLTGDKAASARIIANEVGIDDVQSELFPEDKVAAVKNATESTHQNQSMPARIMRCITGESRNRQVTMRRRQRCPCTCSRRHRHGHDRRHVHRSFRIRASGHHE